MNFAINNAMIGILKKLNQFVEILTKAKCVLVTMILKTLEKKFMLDGTGVIPLIKEHQLHGVIRIAMMALDNYTLLVTQILQNKTRLVIAHLTQFQVEDVSLLTPEHQLHGVILIVTTELDNFTQHVTPAHQDRTKHATVDREKKIHCLKKIYIDLFYVFYVMT